MKRIVKKVFAFTLALTLCITQLAMPVLADTTAPNAGAAAPVPQAISPETPLPSAPGDTYDYSSQVYDHGVGGVSTVETETWTRSEVTDTAPSSGTTTPADPADGTATTTETSGNVIVTKEGEQTTTTKMGPDSASQEIVGKEDITTTDTTKTVTTTTDVVMEDTNTNPVDGATGSDTTGFGDYSATENKTDTEIKEDDSWTEVDGTRHQVGQTQTEEITVPKPGDVTLTMTQTAANPDTDTKTFVKDIDGILPSEGFQADGSKWDAGDVVEMDGEKWNVSYEENEVADPSNPGKTMTVVTGVTFTRVVSTTEGETQWDYANAPDFADKTGAQPTTSILEQTSYLPVTPGYDDVDEGEGTKVSVNLPEVSDYTPGTYTTDANGDPLVDSLGRPVERTIEAIVENGVTTGYKVTDVVRTTSNATVDTQINPTVTQEIPAFKPTANPPVRSGGTTTTETVTSFTDANGKTAYRLTKVITDDYTGKTLYTETNEYFAGTTTTNETIVTTPTSDERVITTETIVKGTRETQLSSREIDGTSTNTRTLQAMEYDLINYNDGIYVRYEGKLYKVVASSNHGNIKMESLKPQDGLIVGGSTGTINTETQLREPTTRTDPLDKVDGMEWQYLDYGLESMFRIKSSGSSDNGTLVHQFILEDSEGNEQYVYCADYSTNAVFGASYDMDNIANSSYFDRDGDNKLSAEEKEDAKHMEVIALNCYWGTEANTRGSLEWVRDILLEAKANDTTGAYDDVSVDEINSLTHGQALAASQAALWYYGNCDGVNELGSDIVGGANGGTKTSTDEKLIKAMYKALLGLSPDSTDNTTTELLNENNFATEASITVKEKVYTDETETEVLLGDNDRETFVTDVKVTLDVKRSSLTGNLILALQVPDGKGGVRTLDWVSLSDENSNILGYLTADGTVDDNRSTYTFKDIQLEEGVKFSLTVTGAQELKTGAYMYSAAVYSDSQTFVGVASGERQVNLSVEMEFNVEDPAAKVTTKKVEWEETDTDNHKRVEEGMKIKDNVETETNVNIATLVKGTRVSTKMVTKKITQQRQWNSYIEYLYDLTTGGGGGGNDDDGDGLTIPDELVPLAAAPKTGDASQIFAAVSLISLSGCLLLKKKEF